MIIHYVSNKTTQEEIKAIRDHYKQSGRKVIVVVSGKEDIKENLKDFIMARAT